MKRIFKITALALVIMLSSSLRNKASAQPYGGSEVSYQNFYDELSPYGRWIEYPEYGYVWSPDAGNDFRPYNSNGHWVYSDEYEWMWVSDYDWGWAAFHYGRWLNDPYYGWLWVPGYEWAPAWVAWRSGGDYYGWAPLRPGISIGINFSLGNYYAPDDYWSFAPRRYITSPRIYDYCVDRRQNINIINNTIIINNFSRGGNVFVTGPGRNDVERYTGRISPVRFRESSRPGRTEFRNNEVSVYRPNIQRDNNRGFSPRNFDRYDRQAQTNDNRISRNDNVSTGGNTLPVRRDGNGNGNSPFERRNNNEVRQPQNNNGVPDRRQFDRRSDNTQPQRQTSPPVEQRPNQFDRRSDNSQPQRQTSPQVEQRPNQFDRRSDNSQPQRQTSPQVEQRPNQFDRRSENSQPQRQASPQAEQQPRQFERRNDNAQPQRQTPPQVEQQPRQFERRNDNAQPQRQTSPQVEQQQPRQMERRDNGNSGREQNNGRGNGRRKE